MRPCTGEGLQYNEGSGGGNGQLGSVYDLPGSLLHVKLHMPQHVELKWEVACHRMSHGHAKGQKKRKRGGGNGSPEVFPIISRHSFPLALTQTFYPRIYEFVLYGTLQNGALQSSQREVQEGWGNEHAYQSQVSLQPHLGPLNILYRDLERKGSCPNSTIGHAKMSKNIGGGEGHMTSLEVFPSSLALLSLSTHHRPSILSI